MRIQRVTADIKDPGVSNLKVIGSLIISLVLLAMGMFMILMPSSPKEIVVIGSSLITLVGKYWLENEKNKK